MTYEELLAVLNDVITDDIHHLATQTAQALRAVVELHKPIEYTPYCEGCDLLRRYYPCPTIQAIEKELS